MNWIKKKLYKLDTSNDYMKEYNYMDKEELKEAKKELDKEGLMLLYGFGSKPVSIGYKKINK